VVDFRGVARLLGETVATTSRRTPFRFGLHVTRAMSVRDLRALAREAEASGYSTIVFPDHLGSHIAPIPAMAMAAEATNTLRVGTFVINNGLRNPVVLAHELATLDLLSDGRLEVGLGAGYAEAEHRMAGIPFDAMPARADRLEESLDILTRALAGERFTYSGEHYNLTEVECFPDCAQRPHPPFHVAGGSKGVLSLAGRRAQIAGLGARRRADGDLDPASITSASTERKIEWIREAAGPRFAELEINTYPVLSEVTITDHARREIGHIRDQLRRRAPGADLSEGELADSPHVFVGSTENLVAKLEGLRDRFGINYICSRDSVAFAPVIERLAGT
jgi:probable F420-dependent oxidoreductase